MNITFKDGTQKSCAVPMEQKIFKNGGGAAWVFTFRIAGNISSDELDGILTEDNISSMVLSAGGEGTAVSLNGYNRISSCAIRYSDSVSESCAEIQLVKEITESV